MTDAIGCRSCWRRLTRDDRHVLFACGDAACADCLAATVRSSLLQPALLPLMCCQQPIPLAVATATLQPYEAAYYAMAVKEAVRRKRQLVADGQRLVATCCGCRSNVELASAADAEQLVLECGHAYCADCLPAASECCAQLAPTPMVGGKEFVPPRTVRGDEFVPVPNHRPLARAAVNVSSKPTANRHQHEQLVIELSDDDDEEDHSLHVKAEFCYACDTMVHAATTRFAAPCGHAFCRSCLQQRAQRALQNEEQGSIGLPVRCCQQIIPLDIMRPALTTRSFVKYEAMVAKRGDAVAKLPSGKKRAAPSANGKAALKRPKVGANKTDQADANKTNSAVCVACMEATTDPLIGPCSHAYCVNCLKMMALQSIEDRSRVPIRCCAQEFPVDYVQKVLPKAKHTKYLRFLAEMDWRNSGLKTDKEYADMIKAQGWKQCPACGVGVEKVTGCNAVKCLRGHYFCFMCGRAPTGDDRCTCGTGDLLAHGFRG